MYRCGHVVAVRRDDGLDRSKLLGQSHDVATSRAGGAERRRMRSVNERRSTLIAGAAALTPSGKNGIIPSASFLLTSAPGDAASTGRPKLIERLTSFE